MARRLLSWPQGLGNVSMEILSGPRAVGSGQTESIGNFIQTFGSPFGSIRIRLNFSPMRDEAARRFRGWITALHGGANATRVPWVDADRMSLLEAGVKGPIENPPWSNGKPWGNGKNWRASYPPVHVAAPAALGSTIVQLADEFWGHRLGYGDQFGFFPFHFGVYEVTEVLGEGTYRIWPSLRKAVSPDDFATLTPSLVMRLESEEAANRNREADFIRSGSVTMVEVFDYDVREYFTA
jgi:hypothetical protein